jgi:hypothetical protein
VLLSSDRSYTLGAAAPVDDLRLVDLVPRVVGCREARRVTDRAVDVDGAAAHATDQVVVVVARARLVARGRTGGLDAADEPLLGEDPERVVDRLA